MAGIDTTNLSTVELEATRRLLQHPKYELIPLKTVVERARLLPTGSMVTVTASPSQGMQVTVDTAIELSGLGFDVTPHLSARLTRDRRELESTLRQLDDAGIAKAFVVGGDSDEAGDFPDGLSLLEAMDDIGHGLTEIGVPGYPEGHHFLPDDVMRKALVDKAPYVSYVTSQMCFRPEAVTAWVDDLHNSGIALDVWIGIPGVAELLKLVRIAARIGVGESRRFLSKQRGLAGKLVRPGGYSPDDLVLGLAPLLAKPEAAVRGFHVYTFNQTADTETWRHDMLEQL